MLTVITHTKNERPELLERCKTSVQAALPPGGQHLIIECPDRPTWNKRRVLDAKQHELVAFVDDDDYIHPDSLKLCLAAIQQTGLGAACTDEVEVDGDGRFIRRINSRKTYVDSTVHPRIIHHICVMRGDFVDERSIEFNDRFGVGIDWFIREGVILRHGCVHVPIDGYFWTQHPGQHTVHSRDLYSRSMREMQQLIRNTWYGPFTGPLPVFDVTTANIVTT